MTMIGVTVGVVAAASLVAYGFSQSDDDREPTTDTPPTIGVIQAPAQVNTTQALVGAPSPGTTDDVSVIPIGTLDVAFPPDSIDIPAP